MLFLLMSNDSKMSKLSPYPPGLPLKSKITFSHPSALKRYNDFSRIFIRRELSGKNLGIEIYQMLLNTHIIFSILSF